MCPPGAAPTGAVVSLLDPRTALCHGYEPGQGEKLAYYYCYYLPRTSMMGMSLGKAFT